MSFLFDFVAVLQAYSAQHCSVEHNNLMAKRWAAIDLPRNLPRLYQRLLAIAVLTEKCDTVPDYYQALENWGHSIEQILTLKSVVASKQDLSEVYLDYPTVERSYLLQLVVILRQHL